MIVTRALGKHNALTLWVPALFFAKPSYNKYICMNLYRIEVARQQCLLFGCPTGTNSCPAGNWASGYVKPCCSITQIDAFKTLLIS